MPPPQPPPNPDMIKAQIEQQKMQGQMQLQQAKQQSDMATEHARMQADMALEQQKFEHQKQLDMLEMGMKREEHQQKMEHEHVKVQTSAALAKHQAGLQPIAEQEDRCDTQLAREKMASDHENTKLGLVGGMATKGSTGSHEHIAKIASALNAPHEQHAQSINMLAQHLKQLHQSHAEAHKQTTEALSHVIKHLAAPKKIIRDPKTNRAIGSERVLQ